MAKRSHWAIWLTLATILLVGLIIRARVAWLDIYPSVDGVFYLNQSREFIQSGRISFSSFPPGWPMLAALPLMFMDSGDPLTVFRSAQIVNVLLGTLFPLLSFVAIRRFVGSIPALLGALILVGLPLCITASKGDLSDLSYASVFLGAWLLFQDRRQFLSGLVFGYAYLIRPEALIAVFFFGLYLLWRGRRFPRGFLIGVLFCLVPYLVYIKLEAGSWAISSKMVFLADSLEAHPGPAFLALVGSNLITIMGLLPGTIGIPLVFLFLWGMWRCGGSYLLALTPLLILPLFDFAMMGRFWLPYLPFVFIAAGLGWDDLRGVCRRRFSYMCCTRARNRGLIAIFVIVVVVGVVGVSSDDAHWVTRNPGAYVGMRDAGIWLQKYVGPETAIAAYKPFTSFWAGCRFIPYPANTEARLLVDKVVSQGAEYLIVNFNVVRHHMRELIPLVEEPAQAWISEKLELVNVFHYSLDGHTTVVYRVKNISPGIGSK